MYNSSILIYKLLYILLFFKIKYYFYEASAPQGYVTDGRIYEVNVYDDNDLIEVSVLNNKMPVTSDIYELPKRFSMVGLGFGLLSLSFAAIYEKCKKN